MSRTPDQPASSRGAELVGQYSLLHASRTYGNTSVKNLRFIRPQVRMLAPSSVIDFGCGRSELLERLELGPGVVLRRFDPAIPEYSEMPKEASDLLINIDVLEHVPEPDLPGLIETMRGLGRNAIIVIDTKPASMILPNGENAHCTLHGHDWWRDYLGRFYPVLEPIRVARRSRAAFRTWTLSPAQKAELALRRTGETVAYWAARLAR